MRPPRRNGPPEGFQMAPMIDMVFLLLVFFMCVSTLSQAGSRHPLNLARSTASEVPDELSGRRVISIDAEGGAYLGGEGMSLDALKLKLETFRQNEPGGRVYLRIDRQTPFSAVRVVLRSCTEAGIENLIYGTHQE